MNKITKSEYNDMLVIDLEDLTKEQSEVVLNILDNFAQNYSSCYEVGEWFGECRVHDYTVVENGRALTRYVVSMPAQGCNFREPIDELLEMFGGPSFGRNDIYNPAVPGSYSW